MRTNAAGIDIIKRFEGLRTEAYLCPAGRWTIGYGHTSGVKEGQANITPQRAETLLAQDVGFIERRLETRLDAILTDNQFSALVSFVFNLGFEGASRQIQRINSGLMADVEAHWLLYCKVRQGGRLVPLRGLLDRRIAELKLWRAG